MAWYDSGSSVIHVGRALALNMSLKRSTTSLSGRCQFLTVNEIANRTLYPIAMLQISTVKSCQFTGEQGSNHSYHPAS